MHCSTDRNNPERRDAPRRPLGTFMTAVVDDQPALCLATDISRTGVFVRSSSPLLEADGTENTVLMRFSMPGQESMLWACGRVVRNLSQRSIRGTGIRFTYLPENTRAYIHELESAPDADLDCLFEDDGPIAQA